MTNSTQLGLLYALQVTTPDDDAPAIVQRRHVPLDRVEEGPGLVAATVPQEIDVEEWVLLERDCVADPAIDSKPFFGGAWSEEAFMCAAEAFGVSRVASRFAGEQLQGPEALAARVQRDEPFLMRMTFAGRAPDFSQIVGGGIGRLQAIFGEETLSLFTSQVADVLVSFRGALPSKEVVRSLLEQKALDVLLPGLSQSLFNDRSLAKKALLAPIELGRRGAHALGSACEKEFFGGFIKALTSRFSDDEIDRLLEMAEDREKLSDELNRLIGSRVSSGSQRIHKVFGSLTDQLPSYVREFVSLSNIADLGAPPRELWFEFTKEPEGMVLTVFGDKEFSQRGEPVVQGDDEVYPSVRRYTGLRPDDLDADFFTCLMRCQEKSPDFDKFIGEFLGALGEPAPLNPNGGAYSGLPSDGAAEVAWRYLSYHAGIESAKEAAQHRFMVRYRAVILGAKAEPPIEGKELYAMGQRVLKEAASRFREGLLPQREFETICREVQEICDRVKPKESEKPKPMVLPEELIGFTERTLRGIPRDRVGVAKEFLAGACGPEIEKILEAIEPKLAPPVEKTWTGEAKALARTLFSLTLGITPSDLTHPTAFSCIRIACLVARVALFFFAPMWAGTANLFWIIKAVAQQALYSLAELFFPRAMREIAAVKRRVQGRLLSALFLERKSRDNLNHIAALFAASSARFGTLSYRVRGVEIPERPRVSIAHPSVSRVKFRRLRPAPIEDLLPPNEPLSCETVHVEMAYWVETSKDWIGPKRYLYLLEQIKRLPIPGESQFWRDVPEPMLAMEALVKVLFALHQAVRVKDLEVAEGERFIAQYKGYAIMDALARRCPETRLDGFLPNGIDLAVWYGKAKTELYSAQCHDETESLLRYFGLTGMTDEELAAKSRQMQASSPFFRFEDPGILRTCAREFTGWSHEYASRGNSYYPTRATIGPLYPYLAQFAGGSDAATSREEIIELFTEPLGAENPRIPTAFKWLRLSFLFIDPKNKITLHSIEGGVPQLNERENPLRSPINTAVRWWTAGRQVEYLPKGRIGLDRIPGLVRFEVEERVAHHPSAGSLARAGTDRSITQMNIPVARLMQAPRRSETAILNGSHPTIDLWALSGKPRELFEMALSMPASQLPGILRYFTQVDTLNIESLEMLLLQAHTIYPYVRRYPAFAKTLGAFFAKQLSACSFDVKKEEMWKELMRIALLAREEVRAAAGDEAAAAFPDLCALLHAKKEKTQLIAPLLPIRWRFVDPKDLSQEEQERAAVDILLASATLNETRSVYTSDVRAETYFRWRKTLAALLESDRRDAICNALFGTPEEWVWEGRFPQYHSHHCTLSCGPKLVTMYQGDSEKRKIVKRTLQEIFPRSVIRSLSLTGEWLARGEYFLRVLFTREGEALFQLNVAGEIFGFVSEREGESHWLSEDGTKELFMEEDRIIRVTSQEEGARLQVRLDQLPQHNLGLLAWFQPLSTISVEVDRTRPDTMQTLYFDALDLRFQIEGERAEGEGALKGFCIAADQTPFDRYPALQHYGRYLLLEGEGGKVRILLPSDTLQTGALTYLLAEMADQQTSHLIDRYLDEILPQNKEATYFTYTLDRKGHLEASDPAAALHLLCYHLSQQKTQLAYDALALFERLARQGALPLEIGEQLIAFLGFATTCGRSEALEMALRAVATAERNHALFGLAKEQSSSNSKELLWWIVLQGALLKNSSNNAGHLFLPEQDELLLLRKALAHFDAALSGVELDGSFVAAFRKNALEFFALAPEVGKRYEMLRTKYAFQDESTGMSWRGALRSYMHGASRSQTSSANATRGPIGQALTFLQRKRVENNVENLFVSTRRIARTTNWAALPVTLSALTDENIERHLLAYYRLATGERPEGVAPSLFSQKRAAFERSLLFFRTMGRPNTRFVHNWTTVFSRGYAGARLPYAVDFEMVITLAVADRPDDFEETRRHVWEAHQMVALDSFRNMTKPSQNELWDFLKKIEIACKPGLSSFLPSASELWTGVKQYATPQRLAQAALTLSPAAPLVKAEAMVRRAMAVYGALSEEWERAAETERMRAALAAPERREYELPRHALALSDHALEGHLSALHNECFGEVQRAERAAAAQDNLFADADAPFLARMATSCREFADRPQEITRAAPQSREAFATLGRDLERKRYFLREVTLRWRAEVLKRARESSGSRDLLAIIEKNPFTLDEERYLKEIVQAFARSDDAWFARCTTVCDRDRAAFDKTVANYLIAATRLAQAERAKALWEEAQTGREMPMRQLRAALLQPRAYNIETTPLPLLRGYLAFEYAMETLLWKKQVAQLEGMLLGGGERPVLELIMGSGKTFFGMPMTGFFGADRRGVIYHCFPPALAGENIRAISETAQRAFGQSVQRVHIDRKTPLGPNRLRTLLDTHTMAIHEGGALAGTKRDMQALELRFIEMLYSEVCYYRKPGRPRISRFMELLRLIRSQERANVDEAHVGFERKDHLNYPLGRPSFVATNLVHTIGFCLHFLVTDEALARIVQIDAAAPPQIAPEVYESAIKERLAHLIARHPFFGIAERDREQFARYLSRKEEVIPPFVQSHKDKEKIGLARGVLLHILPEALGKQISVDYGPSKIGRGEYARPYRGNEQPAEESTIQNPDEALVKTYLQFLHKGLSEAQVDTLVDDLRKKAQGERIERGDRLAEVGTDEPPLSKAEERFHRWMGTSLFGAIDKKALGRALRPILFYVEQIVAPQVTYYARNLRSDSYNFASMFSSFYACTASPNQNGTFPTNTSVLWDPGTMGEFIDIARSGKTGTVDANSPREALQNTLRDYFSPGSRASALIDTGALFVGLSNKAVVETIRAFVARSRPDIDGIVYFNKEQELVVLDAKSGAIAPLSSSAIPPERRLTYYDQVHTFGTDVKQPEGAVGIVTFGAATTLSDLAQGGGRMRGLKTLGQSLLFVTTRDLAATLGPLTPETILRRVAEKESAAQAMENYLAARQKIANVARRALLDRIIFADTPDKALDLFESYPALLIQQMPEDRFALYGLPEERVSVEKALEEYKETLYKRYGSLLSENDRREIDAIGREPIAYPTSVDKQRVQETLGHEQECETEVQVQVEMQLQTNLQLDKNDNTSRTTLDETLQAWPVTDYNATDAWLTLRPSHPGAVAFLPIAKTLPLSARRAFEPRMYWTNNLLGLDAYTKQPLSPFDPQRKPLLQILVIEHRDTLSTVALSQQEAEEWRERFKHKQASPAARITLYDITLGTALDSNTSHSEALISDERFLKHLMQWKFLASHTMLTPFADPEANQTIMRLAREWIQSSDFDALKRLFQDLYRTHGVMRPFPSDIELLFDAPPEDFL